MNKDTITMQLPKGYTTKVSAQDYPVLSKHKWRAEENKGYTRVSGYANGKKVTMARFILGATESNVFVDHIDCDPLNNTRDNLRLATPKENARNCSKKSAGVPTSRYKGVAWHSRDQRWRTSIEVDGKKIWLGQFHTEIEAAIRYNNAARQHYGEFAYLNQIPRGVELFGV
jgi:hypothetical protein